MKNNCLPLKTTWVAFSGTRHIAVPIAETVLTGTANFKNNQFFQKARKTAIIFFTTLQVLDLNSEMNSADMQGAVAEEVNSRLTKATQELKAKYDRGQGGHDQSVDGPSGTAYKEKHAREQQEKKQSKAGKKSSSGEEKSRSTGVDDDDDVDEDNVDGDEDYELRLIREQRLRQIKNAHHEKLENLGKGHGQFREITQDEFITEVTSSMKVVCHFYHRDFPRSEIMNHHLLKLAQRHVETKFIKIDAEKAPFFVEKASSSF